MKIQAIIVSTTLLASAVGDAAGPRNLPEEVPAKVAQIVTAPKTTPGLTVNLANDKAATGLMLMYGLGLMNYIGLGVYDIYQSGWKAFSHSPAFRLTRTNAIRVLPTVIGLIATGYAHWQKMKIDAIKKGKLSATSVPPSILQKYLSTGLPLATALGTGISLYSQDISGAMYSNTFEWIFKNAWRHVFKGSFRTQIAVFVNSFPVFTIPLNLGTAALIYSRHQELQRLAKI